MREHREPSGYRAAREGAALLLPERGLLAVGGREPEAMLRGVVTSRIPSWERAAEGGVLRVERVYSAILTPKGKMVTDLRLLRGPEGELLLDLPQAGLEATRTHLQKFLPPRLATVLDRTGAWGTVVVLGPGADPLVRGWIHRAGFWTEKTCWPVPAVKGGFAWFHDSGAGRVGVGFREDWGVPARDVWGEAGTMAEFEKWIREQGAVALSDAAAEVLGLEAGRKRFGVEMDESTLPQEADLAEEVLDEEKGCYTGQEVMVRIRDRGHVNRRLRGLVLEGDEVPQRGTQVLVPESRKPVGRLTSAAHSPRIGKILAMAYLDRRVEVGSRVVVGGGGEQMASVKPLSGPGWAEG